MTITEINYDLSIKVILLGESGVGKSNLISRFIHNKYDENIIMTIAIDFNSQEMVIKGKKVRVQIWDTAGQERYRALAKSYYKIANGIILVYDITSLDSFVKAQGWVEEIRRFSMPTVKIMLVGNKIDRFAERRVSTEDAEQFAKENQLMYYETSSKTNENDCVNKAFYRMIEESVD